MAVNKISNNYADAIPYDLYRKMPKAVLAAIAVSHLALVYDESRLWLEDGTLDSEFIESALLKEWGMLHEARIVPQKCPKVPGEIESFGQSATIQSPESHGIGG